MSSKAIPRRSRSGAVREQGPRAIGKMGRSQAVTTFGTGAIYELRTFTNRKSALHSVMIAGLDAWQPHRGKMNPVYEEVLSRILRKSHFLLPPTEGESGRGYDPAVVPAVRFPQVLTCDRCERVGRAGREFHDPGYKGVECSKSGCGGKGIPFRLVVACHDKTDGRQPGHIDDFPYVWWAHRGEKVCDQPAIFVASGGGTTGLGGLSLVCRNCNLPPQSLGGVFSPSALDGFKCSGRRPWLNDVESGCKRSVRTLQRGASNTYFPVTASVLSIPPYSDRLFTLVGSVLNMPLLESLKAGKLDVEMAINICRNYPGLDDPDIYSDDQIREALLVISGKQAIALPTTHEEQLTQERNAIVKGREESDEACDFVAEPISELEDYPLLSEFVSRVVLVHRLREVRALRGFQRVEALPGDPFTVEVAPLSRKSLNWLPAIEVRGEGIYIELDEDHLREWELRPAVQARSSVIVGNLEELFRRNDWQLTSPASAREILVHTLSHLVMKQLALECGYSGNSLRERLYISRTLAGASYAGFLIYTASTASDGTLGGLVSQGEPTRLEPLLAAALMSARWCSSDPLCAESKGQGVDALNLSACHACALVSETSCEMRNTRLDRGLLLGTFESTQAGFFAGAIDSLE